MLLFLCRPIYNTPSCSYRFDTIIMHWRSMIIYLQRLVCYRTNYNQKQPFTAYLYIHTDVYLHKIFVNCRFEAISYTLSDRDMLHIRNSHIDMLFSLLPQLNIKTKYSARNFVQKNFFYGRIDLIQRFFSISAHQIGYGNM